MTQKTVPYSYFCHFCGENQLIRQEYEFGGERYVKWLHFNKNRRRATIICEIGMVALPTEAAETFSRGLKNFHMNRDNEIDWRDE